MKIIVIGCGKLGSGLAVELARRGHAVIVVDSKAAAFERLGASFPGKTIEGIGFDRDVLESAGIGQVDAVVATTGSDDANAVIGRLSRTRYRVPQVIARLHDARQAHLYRSLGVHPVSTITWGVDRICELLSFQQFEAMLTIGDSDLELVRVEAPTLLVGTPVSALTVAGEIQVVSIERGARAFIPISGTRVHDRDVLCLAVMSASKPRLKSMLGGA
ncbi:MAG: TrkA family potassium uptake protein [Propionibacteriaceae bacterium]|nr:TrkA family potassium uptake protein [Propionibacteriaceae bacterium]